MSYPLKQTKQKINNKRLFGFDIETYDNNKSFGCGSFVGKDRYGNIHKLFFRDRKSLIEELKNNIMFRNTMCFATNLGFDFFGTFFHQKDIGNFKVNHSGSRLLQAKTWFKDNSFCASAKNKNIKSKKSRPSLTFRDSMNYAPRMSVKKMGKILTGILGYDMNKLPTPSFCKVNWIQPRNEEEWEEMKAYNIRDSEITYRFMEYFYSVTEGFGATVGLTIAATSMSLFKNKYLGDTKIFTQPKEIYRKIFKAYYGGRTEVFIRGYSKGLNYYDVNSLYPFVMADKEYPDPNSQRIRRQNTTKYILKFEGVSQVDIEIPYTKIPYLPSKEADKMLCRCGKMTGSWTHLELRYVLSRGAKITKVYESIFYTRTCTPFKNFVIDMFEKRKKYKAEKEYNPMEMVVKLLMNALYGKFGERFDDKGEIVHIDQATPEHLKTPNIQRVDDYLILKADQEPKSHCIPIWVCYITAYARLHMQGLIEQHKTYYMDTDSMMTPDILPTGEGLGELKLEMRIDECILCKPKFYILGKDEYSKIKGLNCRLCWSQFKDLKNNPRVPITLFAKFKQAIRQGLKPNELIITSKNLSLEDTKRDWGNKLFSMEENQESEPFMEEQFTQLQKRKKKKLQLAENLNANNKPIIKSGLNNSGEVAPIIKYESINITEPNTPIIEEV